MRDFHIPLFPDKLYHVFNRANGDEALFREPANYHYFLKKFSDHITPVAFTLAWCLVPKHYHFLIRTKPLPVLREHYVQKKQRPLADESLLSDFLMEQFSNWQNSYAKAYNKYFCRKGSLFMDYMLRVEVAKDTQLGNTVFYIHKNPVHHGFATQIGQWFWTSYREYASHRFANIDSREVLEWFGTPEQLIRFHQQPISLKK